MKRLVAGSAGFANAMISLRSFDLLDDAELDRKVSRILSDVRFEGDSAVLRFVNQFERPDLKSVVDARVDMSELREGWDSLDKAEQEVLSTAVDRIRAFHEHQLEKSWSYEDAYKNILGQKVTPIARAGVYVPGGRASYPSTALMTVIPAKVAGVNEVVAVSPINERGNNDFLFAALYKAGVDEVYGIGGAQAIGALAFGTESIDRVDKIVGPGGLYVTAAKRKVFGYVGVDSIAGPTELVILADGSAPVDWVVYDLLSQAEHDVAAQSILVATDADYLDRVCERISELLPSFSRKAIIEESLKGRGALILVKGLDQGVDVVNDIAPEHLQLCTVAPEKLLPGIVNAGAIFCGSFSGEAFGDYLAGPSHVLPTFGSARFGSPLGVYDFLKRSSIIHMSEHGADALSDSASLFAQKEGLEAHSLAAKSRSKKLKPNDLLIG